MDIDYLYFLYTLANYLIVTANEIKKAYLSSGASNIVLLGRDAWPLFPLLKVLNIPVQYFHWSRCQLKGDEFLGYSEADRSTIRQWLKEIPENSLVIDTGYKGTIFEFIKLIDSSCQFLLIASTSYYCQLDLPFDNNYFVSQLEKLAKLTKRCSGYSASGKALFKGKWDEAEETCSLQFIINSNKLLCWFMGINLNWAYYTGFTLESRLGEMPNKIHYRNRPKLKGIYICDHKGNPTIHYSIARPLWKTEIAERLKDIPNRSYVKLVSETGHIKYNHGFMEGEPTFTIYRKDGIWVLEVASDNDCEDWMAPYYL